MQIIKHTYRLRALSLFLFHSMLIGFLVLCFESCSMNRLIVRSTASVLEEGVQALYEETDLIIAEASLVSHLKLVESFLKSDPTNRGLLLLLSQGYYAYAMGFVEDEDQQRAQLLYLRGRNYALKALETDVHVADLLELTLDDFQSAIGEVKEKKLSSLFWCAMNWGNWILLNLNKPHALIDLAKVEMMMKHVLDIKESIFFASPHIFFGILDAARPVLLGGNPKRALKHFESAQSLNKQQLMLIDFYVARFYAVQILDDHLFEEKLQHVIDFDVTSVPDIALLNKIAQMKARLWMNKKNELF